MILSLHALKTVFNWFVGNKLPKSSFLISSLLKVFFSLLLSILSWFSCLSLSPTHTLMLTHPSPIRLFSSHPGGVWGCGSMWKPSHRERLMCSSFEAICPKHAVSLHLDMCVCMCVRVGVCAFVFVYVSMTKNGSGECLCLVLKKKLYFCISVVETVWYTIVFLLSPLSPHSAVTFIYIYKCPFPACIFNKTSSI